MNDNEKLDKIIRKGLDVRPSDGTYTRLRDVVLSAHGPAKTTESALTLIIRRGRTVFVRTRARKVAAVLGILVSVGAISAVGVNIGRYYYHGKNDAGDHLFVSEDREDFVTMDGDGVTDVEQARTDLEEIAGLRQQNKRELLRVKETMIGIYRLKTHEYRYRLSDGRTKDMGEPADEMTVYSQDQWKEFSPQLEEFRRLQKAGTGEDLGTYEEPVAGRVFSFKRERYHLGDGTEIIWSVGTPKEDQ